jgi:uncharacterized protein YcfJ
MKSVLTFSPLLIVALVSACAESGANYAPILDGEPTAAYARDLRACQTLAANQRQFDRQTAGSAALGAGVGALAGMADDDVSESEGIAAGLVVGALVGTAAGASEASDRREAIVVECLRGRGHRVVG